MIATVTLNPNLDRTMTVDRLVLDESKLCHHYDVERLLPQLKIDPK